MNFIDPNVGPLFYQVGNMVGDMLKPEQVVVLQKKVQDLEELVRSLQAENAAMKVRIEQLEQHPGASPKLLVGEAMRILENLVVAKIMGSKKQMRKRFVYDFDDLVKEKGETTLEEVVSPELQKAIRFFKKLGNEGVHDVTFTKDELLSAFDKLGAQEDTKVALVTMLEEYSNAMHLPS